MTYNSGHLRPTKKKQKQEKKPASHQIFTCSKLKIETLDKDVKYIQIQQ